ncbi:5-carboxymethyl-2-hydroxymuconate Delta-isomerase [Ruegeria sp. 2205SS24-7]|uniref:5-carboxymethyl-2-hydroxymuconate Delta-isomerase n=1 Tax=Ruegeria discodermiae TaxID=3064389 RepID=UPI0027415652|nr:5-carboxymethyl-2-hydroxymuconate Delta-isomerase [Ruegeria sp. 2205SS24-7]MDP5217074.1 5-carboxymethyl-2-hydroxymuconate Delta-isomerase [Ruegeria sp. 2205SS24-7]
MPHLSIEYSANLEDRVDISALCACLRQAAADIEAFPLAGLRVRALRADHYAIADGDPKHGFVDISVRLRAGRPMEIRKAAADVLFRAAEEFLRPYMAQHSLALSLEMRDIDPELSPKTGTIREYLGGQS